MRDPLKTWKVTRFCCTSGMCLDCRAVANGTKRKRITHASRLDEATADRMVSGWKSYEAKKERM